MFSVGFDQVGKFQQDAAAIHGRHARPFGKRALRGSDRLVDIGLAGHRDLRDLGIVMRVECSQRFAGFGGDEFAINEKFGVNNTLQGSRDLRLGDWLVHACSGNVWADGREMMVFAFGSAHPTVL